MKKKSVAFIVLFISNIIPCLLQAQKSPDLAGAWTGEMYMDTTKKFIPFELVLSNRNGDLSGFSYTVFMVDSVPNIGVKEVSVKEKKGVIVIKDRKLIDDNYTGEPDKGVFTTFELTFSENDSFEILSGKWYTNKTKEFYAVNGTVTLQKKKQFMQTRIVPKLIALGLGGRLSFLHNNQYDIAANQNNSPADSSEKMITIVEPEMVITLPNKKPAIKLPDMNALDSVSSLKKDTLQSIDPGVSKNAGKSAFESKQEFAKQPSGKTKTDQKQNEVAGQNNVNLQQKKTEIITAKTPAPKGNNHPGPDVITITKKNENEILKIDEKSAFDGKDSASKLSVKITPNDEKKFGNIQKSPSGKTGSDTLKKDVVLENNQKSAFETKAPQLRVIDISKREIETIRTVNVKRDSIVLSLYDNGAVDGDTVSVLLNGQVLISKVGLLEKAFNKTIYLTPDMGDSIRIILYAENLGSIPPNTGLLVVRDGDKDYEIRFSGDLQKNSAIILTRKRE